MNNTIFIEELTNWGCDMKGAINRVCGNEDLLIKLINIFAKDDSVEKLGELIEQKDAKKAFEVAHGLKGVSGNLGVTPVYLKVCDIVDILRKDSLENTDTLFSEINRLFNEFSSIVNGIY